MADFKISRIRYKWKGIWNSNTDYIPDDIVQYAGKVFVCLVKHTSSGEIYTDINLLNSDIPPQPIPRWELIMDGKTWKGNWESNIFYDEGDIVKYHGINYICINKHVSSDSDSTSQEEFENDKSNWIIYSESIDWREFWQTNTYYRLNDVVKYGGNIYRCIDEHTSSATTDIGLESDISKWVVVSLSDSWQGDWTISTRYIENNVVRYGSKTYRCIVPHISDAELNGGFESDISNWEIVTSGIEYKGEWNEQFEYYKVNDLVKFGGGLWLANQSHVPGITFDESKWILYTPGFQYEDIWLVATNYQPGDLVRYGGYLYKSLTFNSGIVPTQSSQDWILIQAGVNLRGDWKPTLFYSVGDVVRRTGKLYTALNDNTGEDPNESQDWELVIPGSSWKNFWQYPVVYTIGDVVTFRGTAYRSKQKHTSSGNVVDANRPDYDTGNLFWDILIEGTAGNVLSQIGDIKTVDIGDDGQTIEKVALPIGKVGKVARVVNGSVKWEYFQESNNVFYVSPDGVDDPDHGNTLQNPWRTVRFACEQVTGPATIFVKHGVYEEVLPIRVPAFVAIVGDELRGTTIKAADTIIPEDDVSITVNTFVRVKFVLLRVLTGVPIETTAESLQVIPQNPVTASDYNIVDDLIEAHIAALTASQEPPITSTNTETNIQTRLDIIDIIESNREFIIDDVLIFADNLASNIGYAYKRDRCRRDLNLILNAIQYDLKYPGNWKVIEAGRYYANAADGLRNKRTNMFLLRDGTGLRNMTLQGLFGNLTPPQGTLFSLQRPLGGAYASLDPGWGPEDSTAWVGTRSPYVQNITTFGTGCVGLKIDGELHNGGNKTIVANDFTQILSDGIGAWVNKDGASELVSVFTYYNHIGYLAENGGKIRATNGNNSYGLFGCVAKGVNDTEIPIQASVFNRFFNASIARVLISTATGIEKVFYSNAGQNYTQGLISFTGSGINVSAVVDEFRDGSVFQIRIVDPGDSSAAGGSGYLFTTNSAQGGNKTSIILAGSDENFDFNYIGMRVFITAGTGTGQYGYISAYNSVGKVASISRESDNEPGWDHINSGTPIVNFLDITTFYAIEPRVIVNSPGFSFEETTLPSLEEWKSIAFGDGRFVAIATNSSDSVAYSDDGETWISTTLPEISNWSKITYGDDKFVAVSESGISAYSIDGINWQLTSGMPSAAWKDIIFADNKFLAVGARTNLVAYSFDGINWESSLIGEYANWQSVTYGKNKFIAVAPTDSTISGIMTSDDGLTWTSIDVPGDWRFVTYGNGRFIAIDTVVGARYSFDGINWESNGLPVSEPDWSDLIYKNGIFILISRGSRIVLTSEDGINWDFNQVDETDLWSGIAYGDNKFIMISGAGTDSSKRDIARIIRTGTRTKVRATVVAGRLSQFLIWETGSGYQTVPEFNIIDPNVSSPVSAVVRVANGVLSNPTIVNPGEFFQSNTTRATIVGDGFADEFQIGKDLIVTNIGRIPSPGDNLIIDGIDDYVYKVVSATLLEGTLPGGIVRLTIIKPLDRAESPEHLTDVEIRQEYSQIRITGHDFLDIGLGNFEQTNYPNTLNPNGTVLAPENEFEELDGGRVFYTSTDQDGNFRVGELFRVDQATGAVTLNAEFFQLQGLEELKLGGVTVGGTGVVIREFSTDSTFTADSNNIIPTERAIKKYLESRVSGGGSEAITGGVTAGTVVIGPNLFDTTSGLQINIPDKVYFKNGVDGSLLALNYFLKDPFN